MIKRESKEKQLPIMEIDGHYIRMHEEEQRGTHPSVSWKLTFTFFAEPRSSETNKIALTFAIVNDNENKLMPFNNSKTAASVVFNSITDIHPFTFSSPMSSE